MQTRFWVDKHVFAVHGEILSGAATVSSQNENVRFHQNRNVLFFGGEDLKSCSNPVSRSPSSSEQHALRCGRVKLSTKRSSFDSLKA